MTTPVKLLQRFLTALGQADILALLWGDGPRRAKNR